MKFPMHIGHSLQKFNPMEIHEVNLKIKQTWKKAYITGLFEGAIACLIMFAVFALVF